MTVTSHTYSTWLDGRCVCCQGYLDSYRGEDGAEIGCELIGYNGVMGISICGRCSANNHLSDSSVTGLEEVRAAVIDAVCTRNDARLYSVLGLHVWTDGSLRSWPEPDWDNIAPIAVIIIKDAEADADV